MFSLLCVLNTHARTHIDARARVRVREVVRRRRLIDIDLGGFRFSRDCDRAASARHLLDLRQNVTGEFPHRLLVNYEDERKRILYIFPLSLSFPFSLSLSLSLSLSVSLALMRLSSFRLIRLVESRMERYLKRVQIDNLSKKENAFTLKRTSVTRMVHKFRKGRRACAREKS